MGEYDPIREQRLVELSKRYAPLISKRWQRLAKLWIGDESPEREPRHADKKRYFFDHQGSECKLSLWYGTMEYLPEGLADLDGYGFYEEDRHNPLVVIYSTMLYPFDRPFHLHVHDRYGTFLKSENFKCATFEEFVNTYDMIRAAVLKPWE